MFQPDFLLVDVNNAAYRAFHTTGELRYEERATGTLYGLLKACQDLERRFGTNNLVFCFDSMRSQRTTLYPAYKAQRKEKRDEEDEEAKHARAEFRLQVMEFRDWLREHGCQNVLKVDGFEADDLIASAVNCNRDKNLMIISSDEDLWQLLEENRVTCYRPTQKNYYTASDLMNEYGLLPAQWASAKAWAGDVSDNIIGLKGVGMKTAAKFLLGKVKEPTRFTDHIETYNLNIQLTRLPFPKTPAVCLLPQEQAIPWELLAKEIGCKDTVLPGVA